MTNTLSRSLLLAGALLGPTAAAQDHPNIIFFLVDDMGWQETSVPFYKERTPLNDRYRTPNMERLARMGVKFTQAYACAVSSPSRCSMLSGMNAARHRVTNWTQRYNIKTDAASDVMILPDWNCNGLQPAGKAAAHDVPHSTLITALPQILQDNGYYTIHCGKAHFAAKGTMGENPSNFGFDVNIAGAANGSPASYLAENEYGSGVNHVIGLESYYTKGTFLTEALTIEALKALEVPVARKQPFYLYMSHYAIHIPYDADKRFTPHYQTPDGKGVYDKLLQAPLNEQEINHAALLEGMDKSLGDILDYLEQHPDVARNTIVLFMSDNGGQGVSVRQGRMNRDQNYPARGGKGSAFEGGVHEPMMVYWPGVTQGGTVNRNRVMVEDFFPTILDMAGVSHYQTVQKIDGRSFADLLRHPRRHRDRVVIWHYPNLWGESQDKAEGYGAYSAIMKGDYHLIYTWETRQLRLYNVRKDIGETTDLSARKPKLVRRLARELTDSLQSYQAQRPMLKATGQPIAWPAEAAEAL